MIDPEKPPLDPRTFDLIEIELHTIDQTHWPFLAEKQVAPESGLPKTLRPPKVRNLLLNTLEVYAGNLFKAEADKYGEFRNDPRYVYWLQKLADRVVARVFETISVIERANHPATMEYHGLTDDKIRQGLGFFLVKAQNGYVWRSGSRSLEIDAAAMRKAQKSTEPAPAPKARLSSTVFNPSAARKMESYIAAKGIGLTDFASSAGTTDRTLRSFRKTGRVSRSILAGIAKAMGTTKEELIKSH